MDKMNTFDDAGINFNGRSRLRLRLLFVQNMEIRKGSYIHKMKLQPNRCVVSIDGHVIDIL